MTEIIASETIRYSNDTNTSNATTLWIKVKELTVTDSYTGSWRISFGLATSVNYQYVYAQIRLNDAVYGSEVTSSSLTYQYRVADFTSININVGDKIQLWVTSAGTSRAAKTQNFRIKFDTVATSITASNAIKYSDDSISSIYTMSWGYTEAILKTLTMTDSYTGSWRISFDLRGEDFEEYGSTSWRGRIYKNGVAYGTDRIINAPPYYFGPTTYTEDLLGININVGDVIQLLCGITAGDGNVYVSNFRIMFDAPPGSASFTSSPSGARIWIDGVDKGVDTPNTISGLQPGSHNYTLKLAGYLDTSGTFSVTSGQTTTVPLVTLTPATGSASFTSNPSVARIWVDGVDKGVNTPNTISDLSAGSHSYTLKLVGYQDTSGSFSVIVGSTTTVPLVTFPASAYFTSTPIGATVWVDDTNLDTVTPATVVGLTAGTHAYRLIKIGYTNRGSFSAVAGTTTNVSATLTAVGLNGSIWVEDQYLCYIDANNVVTYIVGTNSGVVAGLVGSIWIEGTQIAYIDASNNKRLLSATAIGAVAGLSGSLWVGGSNIYHIASGIQQASDISLRYSDDVEIFVPNGWQYVKYYTLTTALRRPVTVAFEICINQDIYGGQLGTVRIKDNIYPNVNDHDYSYDVGSWKPYPAGYTRIVHEIQVNLIAGNSLYLIIGASSYGLYVKNYRIYY